MTRDKLIKFLAVIAIGIVLYLIPPPAGLTPKAWHMFIIYFCAILGMVLRPLPEPVILFAAIMVSSAFLRNMNDILRAGYAFSTTWLVFSAFGLSTAFIKTNLGKRIAYLLIGKLGNSTLGLGYVAMCLETILSPAMPSNIARTGGTVFPLLTSLAETLDSRPGPTARRVGAYLMLAEWNLCKTSSYLFLTGFAGNLLAISVSKGITGMDVSWASWALAACVPGGLMMLLIPWLVYVLYPPELKRIDGKALSEAGLKELGPLSSKEKALLVIFVLSLLCWIFGDTLKVHASVVGIGALVMCIIADIITWDDMLKNKQAWSTLIWFGGIVGLSGALIQTGFFKWVAVATKNAIPPGLSGFTFVVVVVFVSVALRYFFASGNAYVASMMPVFLTLGMSANAPMGALLYMLLFSNSYGGMTTHYGGAPAPVLFGAGYNDVKSWWIVGAILAVGTYALHITLGVAWLKFVGLY